jgi:hypothetical protein
VLEIGPFQGQHTQLLVEGGVKTATLVEPNAEAAAYLQQHYNFDVVVADAYRYLNTPKYHDAVLLCGVLYHLHSPLYLLELIANNVNPQYIITETHLSGHELIGNYGYEQLNVPGNRYTGGWRGVGFNCSMSERVMGESMSNLGYKCETSLTHPPMANSDGFYNTKAHSTMAVWRRM